jgi:hypothetical protein
MPPRVRSTFRLTLPGGRPPAIPAWLRAVPGGAEGVSGKPIDEPVGDSTMAKNQQSHPSGAPAAQQRARDEDAREQARRALQASMDTRQ